MGHRICSQVGTSATKWNSSFSCTFVEFMALSTIVSVCARVIKESHTSKTHGLKKHAVEYFLSHLSNSRSPYCVKSVSVSLPYTRVVVMNSEDFLSTNSVCMCVGFFCCWIGCCDSHSFGSPSSRRPRAVQKWDVHFFAVHHAVASIFCLILLRCECQPIGQFSRWRRW